MSYTSSNTGGTTWGFKTYNQIFAPNSETVGAAEYWDKSRVRNLDTVICSTNNKLLTARILPVGDRSGNTAVYWFGTGIYRATLINAGTAFNGDYVVVSDDNTGTYSLPRVTIASATSEREFSAGVVLQAYSAGTLVTIATSGIWPVRISEGFGGVTTVGISGNELEAVAANSGGVGTLGLSTVANYAVVDNSITNPNQWETQLPSGTIIDGNHAIIRSTNAVPIDADHKEGNLILLWGTKREQY